MPSLLPRTRLYSDSPLAEGASVACDEKRAHYLQHVLRLKVGDGIVLFNGRDGEWLASIDAVTKKSVTLAVDKQLRPQQNAPDLWLLCTPLKNSRTDWVAEKATELGISHLCPVTTRFTAIDKTNEARLHAIAVEAAEQSERMDVPQVDALTTLEKRLGNWPAGRMLIYGDESGGGASIASLSLMAGAPYAVLAGPEGGFSKDEFALLRSLKFTKAVTLGPRILRADTAAIALITLVQSFTGDWQVKPAFRNGENHENDH